MCSMIIQTYSIRIAHRKLIRVIIIYLSYITSSFTTPNTCQLSSTTRSCNIVCFFAAIIEATQTTLKFIIRMVNQWRLIWWDIPKSQMMALQNNNSLSPNIWSTSKVMDSQQNYVSVIAYPKVRRNNGQTLNMWPLAIWCTSILATTHLPIDHLLHLA